MEDIEKKYRKLHIQRLKNSGKTSKEIAKQMGITRLSIWESNLTTPSPLSNDLRERISELKKLLGIAKKFKKEKNRELFNIKISECENGIKDILEKEPYNVELKEMLIEVLILRRELQEAMERINEVLNEEPLNLNVKFCLLSIYKIQEAKVRSLNKKRELQAKIKELEDELLGIESDLERIVEEHLDYEDARNDLIKLYKKFNRKDKLIGLLKKIRAFDETDILCRMELGIIYARSKEAKSKAQIEEEIQLQEEIRKLAPENLNCRIYLVNLYKKKNDDDKIIELQEEIRRLSDKDVTSRIELVRLYTNKLNSSSLEEQSELINKIAKLEDEVLAVEKSYLEERPQDTRFKLWVLTRYKRRSCYVRYIELGEEVITNGEIKGEPFEKVIILGVIESYLKSSKNGDIIDEATITRLVELYSKLDGVELDKKDSEAKNSIKTILLRWFQKECGILQQKRFDDINDDMQKTNTQLETFLLKILVIDSENMKARIALCKIYMEQGRIKEAQDIIAPCEEEKSEVIDWIDIKSCRENLAKIEEILLKKDINLDSNLDDFQRVTVRITSLEFMMNKYRKEDSLIIVRKMADEILKLDPKNEMALSVVDVFNRASDKNPEKPGAPENPAGGAGGDHGEK